MKTKRIDEIKFKELTVESSDEVYCAKKARPVKT